MNNLDTVINSLSHLESQFQNLLTCSMSANAFILGYTVQLVWGYFVHWTHTWACLLLSVRPKEAMLLGDSSPRHQQPEGVVLCLVVLSGSPAQPPNTHWLVHSFTLWTHYSVLVICRVCVTGMQSCKKQKQKQRNKKKKKRISSQGAQGLEKTDLKHQFVAQRGKVWGKGRETRAEEAQMRIT